jgi:uncharacterized protein YecT (DUF1311 family)
MTNKIHPRLPLVVGVCLAILFPSLDLAQSGDPFGYKEADAELNNVYQTLARRLDPAEKTFLKNVQRAWITFKERDEELFSKLARDADDVDRISRYRAEATEKRSEDLQRLGAKANPSDRRDAEPATAQEADRMLNNIYKDCFVAAPQEVAPKLKEIEALWIEFRDLHRRLDSALRNGTENDAVLRDLTMNRVVQFRHYVTVLLEKQLPVKENSADETPDLGDNGNVPSLFRFAR